MENAAFREMVFDAQPVAVAVAEQGWFSDSFIFFS